MSKWNTAEATKETARSMCIAYLKYATEQQLYQMVMEEVIHKTYLGLPVRGGLMDAFREEFK